MVRFLGSVESVVVVPVSLEGLRGSAAVRVWVGGVSPETARSYLWVFRRFLRWLGENGGGFAGMGPDELVAWQRERGGYELLDLVQAFVRSHSHLRASTKRQIYTVLRSFFVYNRAELPRDRKFRVRSGVAPVVGTLTVDDVRRIVETSNPCYRAVFLCMFQAGLDIKRLLYWSRTGLESVRRQLRDGVHPLRIELPGRKRNLNKKPYYTFIGRDGIEALKNWLARRPDVDHPDIFLTQFKTPISKNSIHRYWMLRLTRLGLVKRLGGSPGNRYGKNIHEMRDVFRSRWRPSGADPEVAEWCMGHDIDRLGYDKSPWHYPEWFQEQYLLAEPWLNILSQDPEKVPLRDYNKLRETYEQKLAELKQEILQEVLRELRR